MITPFLNKQVRATMLIVGLITAVTVSVQAATIVTYTFAGGVGDASNVATDTISATTAVSGYTNGIIFGFSSSGTGSWFSRLQGTGTTPSFKLPTSLAAATTAGTYLDFSITPNSGKSLDLSTVQVDVYGQNVSGGTTYGPFTGYFNLSVTIGGTTTDLGTQSYTSSLTTTGVASPLTLTYDLSSLADLNVSTASFRLTMYADSSSTYSYYETLRVDTITINANATPEPSTVALSIVGGVMLLIGVQRQALRRKV